VTKIPNKYVGKIKNLTVTVETNKDFGRMAKLDYNISDYI